MRASKLRRQVPHCLYCQSDLASNPHCKVSPTAPQTSPGCVQDALGLGGSLSQDQTGAAPLSAGAGRAVSAHDATPRPAQPAEPTSGSARSAWQGLQREKPLILGGFAAYFRCTFALHSTHVVTPPVHGQDAYLSHSPADHLLVLGRTLLQADLVAVGLHRHPGVLLPTGDGPSWCSRLCERLLADSPAEPLTLVEDLQCSEGCVTARSPQLYAVASCGVFQLTCQALLQI